MIKFLGNKIPIYSIIIEYFLLNFKRFFIIRFIIIHLFKCFCVLFSSVTIHLKDFLSTHVGTYTVKLSSKELLVNNWGRGYNICSFEEILNKILLNKFFCFEISCFNRNTNQGLSVLITPRLKLEFTTQINCIW